MMPHPQFRLRSLFILTALIAVLLAWVPRLATEVRIISVLACAVVGAILGAQAVLLNLVRRRSSNAVKSDTHI
jgi:hypothetical protein